LKIKKNILIPNITDKDVFFARKKARDENPLARISKLSQ